MHGYSLAGFTVLLYPSCESRPFAVFSKLWREKNEKENAFGCFPDMLPTEAEWEYACRAGTTTPFSTGDNITTSQANYDGNYPYNNFSKGTNRKSTTDVGSFPPNSWGLYDMHGNVYEWCWDWYGDYSTSAQADPRGPASGSERVIRGGSWEHYGWYVRSAYRSNGDLSSGWSSVGFRVVRN